MLQRWSLPELLLLDHVYILSAKVSFIIQVCTWVFPEGCYSWKWIDLAVNSDLSVWFLKLHSLGVSEGNYITIKINSLIHLNATLFGYVVIVSLCIMIETDTWYFLIVWEQNWKNQANNTYSIGSTVLAGKGYFHLYLCIKFL